MGKVEGGGRKESGDGLRLEFKRSTDMCHVADLTPWLFTCPLTSFPVSSACAPRSPPCSALLPSSSSARRWFMLYPSLTITIAVLLPLGIAVNWLKRNYK